MKNIKIVLLALIISFFIGYFIINCYESDKTIGFKLGEYTKEEFEKEIISLKNYIYKIKDNKYIIYLGITKNKKNIEKLKGFFIKKGYSISIDNIVIDSKYDDLIRSCDELLEKVDDYESIEKIENKILEIGVI